MYTTYQIPLSPQPQKQRISLSGVYYNLTVKWNIQTNCWILDIADVNNNPMISGMPLITGADLLAQYKYLNFNGILIAACDNNMFQVPDITNLGTTGHLYFIAIS